MTDQVTFIQSLYAAFGRGDLDTILKNCDPAIEWVSNGTAGTIPWAGAHTGVAGAARFFELLAASLDFEAFEPRQFFPSGDTVIVLGRSRARHKHAGKGVFDCEWAHVFSVRDGKLARFQEFYDTAAIERALTV